MLKSTSLGTPLASEDDTSLASASAEWTWWLAEPVVYDGFVEQTHFEATTMTDRTSGRCPILICSKFGQWSDHSHFQ